MHPFYTNKMQVSPGYGEEKRRRCPVDIAADILSLVVYRYHIRLPRKGTDLIIHKRFSPLQFMAFLYILESVAVGFSLSHDPR